MLMEKESELTSRGMEAALFAATVDVSEEVKEQQRDKTKIQLQLGTVE
jgi:hypothetical protein